MASVPIAAALGALTTIQLFVVAAIYGLLFMTSAAGIPSLITRLVDGEDLITANAMESLSFSISGLIGPVAMPPMITGAVWTAASRPTSVGVPPRSIRSHSKATNDIPSPSEEIVAPPQSRAKSRFRRRWR